MSNPISDGIKRLRAQHKLTQTALAEKAGIARATLANMESDNSNPSISLVVKVAQALGVTVDDLILKKSSPHVTEVARADMPTSYQDDNKYISTRTSPISCPNIQVNDINMLPNCFTRGVPHPKGSHELFLCLDGEANVEVQGDSYAVPAGNLIYFQGHLPHCYGNNGIKPVHAISIIFML